MIIYFANRKMSILGHASTNLPRGFVITDDLKTEEIETGIATFSCTVGFNSENRTELEEMMQAGNFVLRSTETENEFYTIIEAEIDTKNQEIYIYAEDAGLDLLNEIVGEFEATEAHTADWYIAKFTRDSGFEIGINEIPESSTRKLVWDSESTATERIASIATQFGGFEVSYTYAIVGMEIAHKYINIFEKRGKDTGETLFLNREIDRIVTKRTVANIATALKCKGGIPDKKDKPITLDGFEYDDGDFYVDGDLLKSRNALEKWSRYQWEGLQTEAEGHIVQQYSYETTSKQTLCEQAITALKKICDVETNYEVELHSLPDNVKIGDRINIVDDAGELYLSTRILLLETSICKQEHKATLGEHLIKTSGISERVQELAEQFAESAAENRRALEAAEIANANATEAKERVDEAVKSVEDAQQALEEVAEVVETAKQSAENAQKAADAAQAIVEGVETTVSGLETAIRNAEQAAAGAQTAAQTAEQKATEASTTAAQAQSVAAGAKEDAQKALEDMDAFTENLETIEETMKADYARKTDLTEATTSLQTQITQNAGQIASTASRVTEIDETANNAAELAQSAQAQAQNAKSEADAAKAEANTAKAKADEAKTAAETATTAASTAQTKATEAQNLANAAKSDLDKAKADLAEVEGRVDATEEEIAAAEQAVASAQAAATKAQTDANTAAQKAQEAQTAANTAVTNAQSAQTTAEQAATKADNAKAAADKAQADADALVTRVTTAETQISQNAEAITLRATKEEVSIAQATANDAQAEATTTNAELTILSDLISTLVSSGSESSILTQTENGWAFNMASYTEADEKAKADIEELIAGISKGEKDINELQTSLNSIGVKTDYINIGTYEGEACIVIGGSEDDFKLRLTKTAIQFVSGTNIPAYIANTTESSKLMIEQAEVVNELKQGGFVWKTETDGSLGLLWKGVS